MHLDLIFRSRRMSFPKRSTVIAVIAIGSTLFLFLHTQNLNSRLKEMQDRLSGPSGGENAINSIINSDYSLNHQDLAVADKKNNDLKSVYNHLKSTGEMSTLSAYDLNNTRKAGKEILFFNRVPKVGSQSLMELLKFLSMRNEFLFHRDTVQRVEYIRLGPYEQQELAEMVVDLPAPSVYVKHVVFTNFTRFSLPSPIYVNLVRDPVERIISWFYYIRAAWYYVERKRAFPDLPMPDPQWLRKDFETCVLQGDPECTFREGDEKEGIGDHRRQTLFFCGHDTVCMPFNTEGALAQAKYSVEKQYSVVGVLEDLNVTLSVLEKYIPRFFDGASEIYWKNIHNHVINKNTFKPPVSEEVKNMVRKNFTREIEFYQFCRQRLYKQYLAVKLPIT